jgi:hypothetical protein
MSNHATATRAQASVRALAAQSESRLAPVAASCRAEQAQPASTAPSHERLVMVVGHFQHRAVCFCGGCSAVGSF